MQRSKVLVSLLITVLPTLASAQTVYTWTDKNGVLHFSDSPGSGQAKRIDMPAIEQPAPAPQFEKLTPKQPKPASPAEQKRPPIPLSLEILSPAHEQAIRSNAGMLTIQAELNRKLHIQESLQLIMNNSAYGAPTSQPLWELRNLDRGTHQFKIQAHRDGKLIASSSSITVHLLRASKKKVVSPVKPN